MLEIKIAHDMRPIQHPASPQTSCRVQTFVDSSSAAFLAPNGDYIHPQYAWIVPASERGQIMLARYTGEQPTTESMGLGRLDHRNFDSLVVKTDYRAETRIFELDYINPPYDVTVPFQILVRREQRGTNVLFQAYHPALDGVVQSTPSASFAHAVQSFRDEISEAIRAHTHNSRNFTQIQRLLAHHITLHDPNEYHGDTGWRYDSYEEGSFAKHVPISVGRSRSNDPFVVENDELKIFGWGPSEAEAFAAFGGQLLLQVQNLEQIADGEKTHEQAAKYRTLVALRDGDLPDRNNTQRPRGPPTLTLVK